MRRTRNFIFNKALTLLSFLILIIVLLIININVIIKNDEIYKNTSTYKLTDFSFIVINPSNDQVDSIANEDSVDDILSTYNFRTTVLGENRETINLLIGIKGNSETGFFNESTVINKDDKEGIILDAFAAEKIGAKVGDEVTLYLKNHSFKVLVSEVHNKVNYSTFTLGVGYIKMSDEIKDALGSNLTIDYAFIKSNDQDKTLNETLKNYVPEGRLISKENYLNNYKLTNPRPSNLTEEEWDIELNLRYDSYVEGFYNSEFVGEVHNKDLKGFEIMNDAEKSQSNIIIISIVLTVLSILVVFGFNMLLTIKHKKDYLERIKESSYQVIKKEFINYYLRLHLMGLIIIVGLFTLFNLVIKLQGLSLTVFISSLIIYIISFSLYFVMPIVLRKPKNKNRGV